MVNLSSQNITHETKKYFSKFCSFFGSEIQEAKVHPVFRVQPDRGRPDWRLGGEHPDVGKISRRHQNSRQRS